MSRLQTILDLLIERFQKALENCYGTEFVNADPVIRPAQSPEFGDYQANCAMALGKRVKKPPREVAEQIINSLDVEDVCETPSIAGPGFINLRLRADYVRRRLDSVLSDERVGVPAVDKPQTVVVDLSGTNLAKEMHVGHLRSTIIGDTISRFLEFLGHNVLRINHLGDWGTQFGMLIQFLREENPTSSDGDNALHLRDLEEFYRQAKERFDRDPKFREASRKAVVDLQSGDPATMASWKSFCDESLRHSHAINHRLDIRLTNQPESFYNDMLPGVVEDLMASGLAVVSDDAVCIFPEGFKNKEGKPLPMIIRKRDGGFNYETTDLAAVRYRVGELGADRIIYVVDARQSLKFQMLFHVVRECGWAPESVVLEHVSFGAVLGKDGRPLKTREGGTIKLADLIEEGVERARRVVDSSSSALPETDRAAIAEAVGIGAIKYADLSQNRISDYRFDWDKLLALDGNTAPYMMYAYARVRSIGREGDVDWSAARRITEGTLSDPHELALGKKVLQFGEAFESAVEELRPNLLTDYLYELARSYSRFYENCPVLKSENEKIRSSRLGLCDLTARTLRLGLGLLGIQTVERM